MTERELDIHRILRFYGYAHQIIKSQEELEELRSALKEKSTPAIIEEMADVFVMLQQLQVIYDYEDSPKIPRDYIIQHLKDKGIKEYIAEARILLEDFRYALKHNLESQEIKKYISRSLLMLEALKLIFDCDAEMKKIEEEKIIRTLKTLWL